MKRFKFHNVAAGAALQDAKRLRPDAEVESVVVDGDRKVKPETAADAYTKALDRVNDSVTLGQEKTTPTQPVREDFSSEADYTAAMQSWNRRQSWQASKAWAADKMKPVGKGAGWLWQNSGVPSAGRFAGRQLHGAAAALGKTGPGRKATFGKDVLLEVLVAAHPQRVQQQHQVAVTFSDDSTQHFNVSVTDPAATLALHRSTMPAQVIAMCPWFPFSGIVTCGAVSYRFFKLARRARTDGDEAMAQALERTGRHMRTLAVAALGWVLAEPVYAAGTAAEAMQRSAMRGTSVATVEAMDGPIVDVGEDASIDRTFRERMQHGWAELKGTFRDAAERVRMKHDAADAHFDEAHIEAALEAAEHAEDAATRALEELEFANRLDEAGLPEAASGMRAQSGDDRAEAAQALRETNARFGDLSDSMKSFLDELPDRSRALPNDAAANRDQV